MVEQEIENITAMDREKNMGKLYIIGDILLSHDYQFGMISFRIGGDINIQRWGCGVF